MDANGLKFWMLADQAHWHLVDDALQYDSASRSLRLARHRDIPDYPANAAEALKNLAIVPQSVDPFGTRAFWMPGQSAVMATGAVPGEVPLLVVAAGESVTDVTLGYDDLLYLAVAGRITILDPRERFQPQDVPPLAGFTAWRLAAHPQGGVWAMDDQGKVARELGSPSTVRPHPPYDASTVRPCQENLDPPRLIRLGDAAIDVGEKAVALASNAQGGLAVLLWQAEDSAHLRLLGPDGSFGPPRKLAGARTPFSLAFLSDTQVALLLPNLKEAPVYSLDDPNSEIPPDGDFYPLRNHDGGPFLHDTTLPPHYPATDGSRGLYRLSLPAYSRTGTAYNNVILDSGRQSTVWHRLYVEAEIPDHCGVVISLGAVNDPGDEPQQWYPHQFGATFLPDSNTPRGVWLSTPSEIPYHPGLLACPRVEDRSGLFTALIQRSGRAVRSLRGRFLRAKVELQGNGLSTPEVAAVRAYASRFSYVDRYLPELYREDSFGEDAEKYGPATRPDFLERFLGNFEGVLTPLEDRIAGSYLLTSPVTTPAEALEWLAGWIGTTFDSAYSEQQRRDLLAATPELYRRRGTTKGLGLALDIATSGAVRRGQIVILEDWRLRRTFATILGADLSDANDPLTAGISRSGNSFVGDTLFLGDPYRKEFLALFADTLPKTLSEARAVEAFFDRLAYRMTILVHREINPQDLGLVRRVAALETPAHVAVRIERATNQFRAGVASLVGVDTYLAPKPVPKTARVDISYFGRGDLIERAPSLDPRLGGEDLADRRPTAELSAPGLVELGTSFHLNAAGSRAFEGKKIVAYLWTLLD
jgi:phage tail-like protein